MEIKIILSYQISPVRDFVRKKRLFKGTGVARKHWPTVSGMKEHSTEVCKRMKD